MVVILAPSESDSYFWVQQQFTATQPNQRWVSDVSCFKLGDHYFYVCVIIDLFSRKVIAYKISKRNSTQLMEPLI